MKKRAILLLTVLLVWLGSDDAAALSLATNGVPNNAHKHNLSSNSTHGSFKADLPVNGGTDEICVFCHTPHGGSAQSTLWNRRASPYMDTFALYNSTTLVIDDADVQADSQYFDNASNPDGYPNGSSRLCMSCHDGNTAESIGDVLNPPNATGGGAITMDSSGTSPPNLGDLSTVHPISFIYNGQVVSAIEDITKKGSGTYQLPGVSYVRLDGNSRMQCTTCHDPHDDNRSKWAGENLPFWRHTTGTTEDECYDQVCAACHIGTAPYPLTPGHGDENPGTFP